MKNVLSKVGLDVHKEMVLLALITPHKRDGISFVVDFFFFSFFFRFLQVLLDAFSLSL